MDLILNKKEDIMKKIITASMALLSVVVAACSGKTTSDSSTKAQAL